MKKLFALILACVMILALAIPVMAQTSDDGFKLSGAHYNLNLIGVSKEKISDITTGNRIFVPLTGSCKINLTETFFPDYTKFNDNFMVLDGNGTDGTAAFQLPNPDPANDGTTVYSVFAKVLGTPGGHSEMTTGATYIDTDGVSWTKMSEISATFDRNGKPSFTNVSKQLLYIYTDLDGIGGAERYNLFNTALQDYFWQYDNQGLKLVQLRFYPIETTVPGSVPVQ